MWIYKQETHSQSQRQTKNILLILSQGASADLETDVLEKALSVAIFASKSDAYLCQSIDRCTNKYPEQKLTQDEIDALKRAFLAEQLDEEAVERLSYDVLEKFEGEYSLDEKFEASVFIWHPQNKSVTNFYVYASIYVIIDLFLFL